MITPQRRAKGFSLVEVVLALGVCSFAMLAIVGMIPLGLSTFRDALNTSVQSQIVQKLASDVLLTEYGNLASSTYYFDEQGELLQSPTPSQLSYTATITPQPLRSPAGLSNDDDHADDPAASVLIQISENTRPSQVFSYSVIVVNRHP